MPIHASETDSRPLVDVLASARPDTRPAIDAVLAALKGLDANSRTWIGDDLKRRIGEEGDGGGRRPDGFVVIYDPDDRALNYLLGSLRGMRRPVLLVVMKQDGNLLPFDLREFRFAIFDPTDTPASVRQVDWAIRLLVEQPAAA